MDLIVGDIWEQGAMRDHDATFYRVIPTNLEGRLGGGLALEARHRYPLCARAYQATLRAGYRSGASDESLALDVCDRAGTPCQIVWLATKERVRLTSSLALIEAGLRALALWAWDMNTFDFRTDVYLPRLGAGLGRLPWSAVRPLFAKYCAPDYFHVVVPAEQVTIQDVDLWGPPRPPVEP